MKSPSRDFFSNFCEGCGTILPLPNEKTSITCKMCKATIHVSVLENIKKTSESRKGIFKSSNLLHPSDKVKEEAATINEECPKCKNQTMSFHTIQLRSADEGQTIFFTCNRCGYKFLYEPLISFECNQSKLFFKCPPIKHYLYNCSYDQSPLTNQIELFISYDQSSLMSFNQSDTTIH